MIQAARSAFLGATLALLSCGTLAQQSASLSVAFSIEQQPMLKALNAWAQQAKLQLIWPAGDQAAQQLSPRVVGRFPPREALQMLLKGSALEATMVDAQTVEIKPVARVGTQRITWEKDEAASPPHVAHSSSAMQKVVESSSDGAAKDSITSTEKKAIDEVVVTGSHIRGVERPSSNIEIGRLDIERSGYTSIGDVVRGLPQNFGGGNNPNATPGTSPGNGNGSPSGGSAPNLRGLGPGSTLTLINGHRLAQDTQWGAVDISLIPLSAVERIEVVTDGSSAAYGSDAVAGVVNVIVKKSVDGAETTAAFGGTSAGGASERKIGQLFGKQWRRGGAVLAYEHESTDAVDAGDRDFTATVPTPYSLLPDGSKHSGFLSVNQDIGDTFSIFADGVASSRSSTNYSTSPPTYEYRANVKQYAAAAGASAVLPNEWKATAVVSAAQQKNVQKEYSYEVFPADRLYDYSTITDGRTYTLEVTADGPLLGRSDSGPRFAIGAGSRVDQFSNSVPEFDLILSDDKRTIDYVFGELQMPLLQPSTKPGLMRLDLNVSGRYEKYSDVGSKSVPKIGIVYVPSDAARFRASWGKSFRAPVLADVSNAPTLNLFRLPDPESSTGSSFALSRGGGNPSLLPEIATSWSAGFDYDAKRLPGLRLSGNYFDISYTNRIGRIASFATALTDPANLAYVTRSPTIELQQSLIDAVNGNLGNFSGAPYDPSTVSSLIEFRQINLARQRIDGVDLLVNYDILVKSGELSLFANATRLRMVERATYASSQEELTGKAFSPPRFRARAGATLSVGSFAATTVVNYLDASVNTLEPGNPAVASWTTIDAQIAYSSGRENGLLEGVKASLSVQNVLDKDPPFVRYDAAFPPGFNYDQLNTSPVGRFALITVSKAW